MFQGHKCHGADGLPKSSRLSCDQCGKSFSTKAYLNQHELKMHTVATLECERCQRKFHQEKDLNKHLCVDEHGNKVSGSLCLIAAGVPGWSLIMGCINKHGGEVRD